MAVSHMSRPVLLVTGFLVLGPAVSAAEPLFESAWTGPGRAWYSVCGDVNGDGLPDLVVASDTGFQVFLNQNGLLASAPVQTASIGFTYAVALGDLDGDGDPDLVCGRGLLPDELFLNESGTFVPGSWTSPDSATTGAAVLGDVDGDGDLDLLTGPGATYYVTPFGGPSTPSAPKRLYRNDDGVLTRTPVWESSGFEDAARMRLGDMNGDGRLDLVSANFADKPWGEITYFGWSLSGIGDLNGDGANDVAVIGWRPQRRNPTVLVFWGGAAFDTQVDFEMSGTGPLTGAPQWRVGGAGDVNGDGVQDLMIGQRTYGTSNSGRVQVFFGGASLDTIADWTLDGSPNQGLGRELLSPGDLNADGFDDLVVRDNLNPGYCRVFFGGSSPDAMSDLALPGGPAAGAGDFNDDGYPDLLVGGPSTVAVYFGGPGLDGAADWQVPGGGQSHQVAGVGDMNGDGIADIAVGTVDPQNGSVRIFFGGSPPDTISDLSLTLPGDASLITLSGPGDLDGDGFSELAVGLPLAEDQRGRVLVYRGGSPPDTTADLVLRGALPEGQFGRSLAAPGDVDGDTRPDLLVGAPLSSEAGYRVGTVTLFSGATPLDGTPDLLLAGETGALLHGGGLSVYLNNGSATVFPPQPTSKRIADPQYPVSLALGDVDGDGDLDAVVGNLFSITPETYGHITLYRNDGGTLTDGPVWMASNPNANRDLALADLDLDGDLDLVAIHQVPMVTTVNIDDDPLAVYFNQDGAFGALPDTSLLPDSPQTWMTVADLDSDGDPDLVTLSEFFTTPSRVLLNRHGHWLAPSADWTSPSGYGSQYGVATGDLDLDGDQDFVLAGDITTGYLLDTSGAGPPFPAAPAWPRYSEAQSAALADLDGDGAPELVLGTGTNGSSLQFEIAPDGMIGSLTWSSAEALGTADLALSDLNGDGWLDLVSANRNLSCASRGQSDTIHFWNPSLGQFQRSRGWTSFTTEHSAGVGVADLSRDGTPDVVFVHDCGSESCVLYRGDGSTLVSPPSIVVEDPGNGLSVGDVSGDGIPDLAVAQSGGDLLLTNNGTGGFFPTSWSGRPNSTRIELADVDGDGDLDAVVGTTGNDALYMNDRGSLDDFPAWVSSEAETTTGMALVDLDGDGDLDALTTHGSTASIHLGLRNPAYRWNTEAPTNQLPDNPPVLRHVTILPVGGTTYRVHLEAADAEGDPFWLYPEYRLESGSLWLPFPLQGSARVGPLAASPQGTVHEFDWDVAGLPITEEPVDVRFRTLSTPHRVQGQTMPGVFQYRMDTLVRRPRIRPPKSPLVFATVAVGDTVTADLQVVNEGNAALTISGVVANLGDMQVGAGFPITTGGKSTVVIPVRLTPTRLLPATGTLEVATDDPLGSPTMYTANLDVRDITVQIRDVVPAVKAPLGKAFSLLITPDPYVHIDSGTIHYKASTDTAVTGSVDLIRVQDVFLATLPAEAMVEVGVDYNLEVERSGIRRVFPSASTFFHKDVEAPKSLSVTAQPNVGSDYVRGQEVRVQVELDAGAIFGSGVLHYRQGGSIAPYRSRPIEPSDPLPSAVIPDSVVGDRGVEYWVEVTTAGGTPLEDPPDSTLHPLSFSTTIPNLEEPSEHAGERYRMVSFPLRFRQDFQGTLAGLLSDQPEFGPYNVKRWRAFRYAPGDGRYLELSEADRQAAFRPEPGRAFWLISREPHRVDTAPITGLSTPTDSSFYLVLEPGWNQIGDPFAFPVSWSDMQVGGVPAGQQSVVQPPVGWDPTAPAAEQYPERPVLVPFEGYWLENSAPDPVRLEIPPREAIPADAAPGEVAAAGPGSGWVVRLEARSEGVVDRGAMVGVRPSASEAWDGQDRSDPPLAPERGLSLYLPHGDWEERPGAYAVDLRSAGDSGFQGAVWRLDVAKGFSDAEAGDEVVLTADTKEVPEGFQVQLVDRVLGRAVPFGHGETYAYLSGVHGEGPDPEAARFELVVGTEAFVRDRGTEGTGSEFRMRLLQNFPNPFRAGTRIRYEMPAEGLARIEIFDIRGRLVRRLTAQVSGPGRYEITWDGRDNTGQTAGPGVYFYRFTGPGKTDTRRMLKIG